MSAQAGICYIDARPVPQEVIERLSRINRDLAPDRRGLFVADGIAMLSFATHFDHLSLEENQPIHSSGGAILTFDGRLDNRDDLIVRFSHREPDLSDAHLMALAFDHSRDRALEAAIGDWSLARWDPTLRELVLARDYAGNRPLYYCRRPDYFSWSTALDALVDVCGLSGCVNDSFIAGWLTFDPPEDHTQYRDIYTVTPGCALRLRFNHAPTSSSFATIAPPYSIRYRTQAQYEDHYRHLFIDAVKVRLRARKPVWAELSGGYDSSAIVCVASDLICAGSAAAPELRPVSVVTPGALESDESRYIECVERRCHLIGTRLPLTGSFELFNDDKYNQHPQASTGYIAPWEAVHAANSNVLLSGQLGDAMTMSVSAETLLLDHIRSLRLQAFVIDAVRHCRSSRTSLAQTLQQLLTTYGGEHNPRRAHTDLVRSIADSQRLSSDDAALVFGLRRDFLARSLVPGRSQFPLFRSLPYSRRRVARALHTFISSHTLGAIKGQCPVRVTYPFSHRPLVQFVFGVPPEVLWSHTHSRAFMCAALRNALPEPIVARRSKGYAPPAVARQLALTIARTVDSVDKWRLVQRGYTEPSLLATKLTAFVSGGSTSLPLILRIVAVENILRQIDGLLPSLGQPTNVYAA